MEIYIELISKTGVQWQRQLIYANAVAHWTVVHFIISKSFLF